MIPARQKSAKEIAEERDREHERYDVYEQRQVDERLRYVFKRLDTKRDGLIDAEEVALMLVQLGCEARAKGGKNTDREAVLEAMPGVAAPADMIWEVDERGDGSLSWEEFSNAYFRVVRDETGAEPRKLFALIEFLMLDEDEVGWVTLDQILRMMMMRHQDIGGIIKAKFDDGSPGVKQISFREYVLAGAPPSGVLEK